MHLYDLIISKKSRWVAPIMAPVGITLTGANIKNAYPDTETQLKSLQKLDEIYHPDINFPLMETYREAKGFLELIGPGDKASNLSLDYFLTHIDSWKQIIPIDPESSATMLSRLRLIEEMRERFDALVGVFATGPFALAERLFGSEEILLRSISYPPDLIQVLEFITKALGNYLSALAERAHIVIVVEPTASSLSSSSFTRFCQPFLKGISGIIRTSGASPMLHICGNSEHLLDNLVSLGMEGICLDSQVNLRKVADLVPLNLIIMGNLDVKIISQGEPDLVREKTRRLLLSMLPYRNFIVSTGCELPGDTPFENIQALMEEARTPIYFKR